MWGREELPEQTVVTTCSLLHRTGGELPFCQYQMFPIFYLKLQGWELKQNVPKHAWAKMRVFTQDMQLDNYVFVRIYHLFNTPGYPNRGWKEGMYAP